MESGEDAKADLSSASASASASSPLLAEASSCHPNDELKKLLAFKVYKRRWFVLLVLCLLNCSNATLWLTFAPVAEQSAQYLQATLTEVNWLSVVFMVVSIPLSLAAIWLLDTVGLRVTLVLGSWLNMFGGVARVMGGPPGDGFRVDFALVMLGQTLAALAQPLVIFAPTKMAALWFPDKQRAVANSAASMANPLGILMANLISPAIARSKQQIPFLMLVYSIPACVTCCLATVGIRSSAPPTPPSASAELSTSEPFVQGVRLLLKNRAYLVLLLCFGSGVGVFTSFITLLEQILCVQGYTNDFAGLCAALLIAFGIAGAALLGFYVDKSKRFTEAIKINMAASALAAIAFSVVCLMQRQGVAMATVCSLFGFFGFSVYPAVMELSVECSFPVGEATSAGLIFMAGQILSIVYIVVLQSLAIPVADSPRSTCGLAPHSWKVSMMVPAVLTTFFTCVFIVVFRTRYKRLEAEEDATYGRTRVDAGVDT
ncbi:solute carrier family 49 member A3 isoform X1 [Festucalex cinctus]